MALALALALALGLKFVPDERDKQHYFLTVTEKMTTIQLREKLVWVADRMSVIREAKLSND